MPELPEVESVVRGLRHEIVGERIAHTRVLWERWAGNLTPQGLARALKGERIQAVERRGKFIIFRFASGAQLLSHLRMTGRWLVDNAECEQSPHLRARLDLESGRFLLFVDPRKFGRALFYPKGEEPKEFERLGAEPLEAAFDATALYDLLHARKRDLKALLMDQRQLAGLGNIYFSESCFRARLSPFRRSDEVTRAEARRLHAAIVAVLEESIAAEGTSFSDYRGARNTEGRFQERLLVYGRAGEPCRVCSASILRTVQGQRSTFYCPSCQKVTRARRASDSPPPTGRTRRGARGGAARSAR